MKNEKHKLWGPIPCGLEFVIVRAENRAITQPQDELVYRLQTQLKYYSWCMNQGVKCPPGLTKNISINTLAIQALSAKSS